MFLDSEAMDSLEQLAKVQLATSLPGIKPVCLVGTADQHGQENLSVFSSVTHFGSSPIILGMVTRPDTVERHTLSNILEREVWTLNHIHPEILESAHQCSAKYPREVSEFDVTGLRPEYFNGFRAPAVKEARVQIGLRLESVIDIPVNETKLILGLVEWVNLSEGALIADGSIDFAKTQSIASTALDTYFSATEIARLPYARPSQA